MQNRPYLYGQLNKSVIEANYEFLPTDTATIYKENDNQVKVDVNKSNIVVIEKHGNQDENNLTYKLVPKETNNINETIDLSNIGRWIDLSIMDKTDIEPYKIKISLKSSQQGITICAKEANLPQLGGTVVEANPAETGSTDLTKIKIGDTVYNISSQGNLFEHRLIYTTTGFSIIVKYITNYDTPLSTFTNDYISALITNFSGNYVPILFHSNNSFYACFSTGSISSIDLSSFTFEGDIVIGL